MIKRISIKNIKKNVLGFSEETQHPHFIGSWNINNDSLCNNIIDLFEQNKTLQKDGITGNGLNLKVKKTKDIMITPNDLKNEKFECVNKYISELYKCYVDYQDQWPFIKNVLSNIHIGSFNIQKYTPGGHFSKIHAERQDIQSSHRLFAWMTYLNNVDDGGTTNFSHFGIKINPEIGKTLIWPAEWTHAHNGEILNSGLKYIVTGWMHFPHDENKDL